MQPLRFAILGAAGYIAARHIQAIQSLGHVVTQVCDSQPLECLGAAQFRHEDEFFAQLSLQQADYLVVCTPSFVHKRQVLLGLLSGLDVICEKPLGLSTTDIAEIIHTATTTQRNVWSIQQLRFHPEVRRLQRTAPQDCRPVVSIRHFVKSSPNSAPWKLDPVQSGGPFFHLGIHFVDVMLWLYGAEQAQPSVVVTRSHIRTDIQLERAHICFELDTNHPKTERTIETHAGSFDISPPTATHDLHVLNYQAILAGQGVSAADTYRTIALCTQLTKAVRRNVTQGEVAMPESP